MLKLQVLYKMQENVLSSTFDKLTPAVILLIFTWGKDKFFFYLFINGFHLFTPGCEGGVYFSQHVLKYVL